MGAICAVANNIILIAGDAVGIPYWALVPLTFVLMVPPSYVAHALWVFGVRTSWAAFGRYVAGTMSSLAVAALTIGLVLPVRAADDDAATTGDTPRVILTANPRAVT